MDYYRTEHIAAGSYKALKKSDRILQAFLGTCLGVALYDRTMNVGGLIHILLPEPPGSFSAEFPEKYASSGIPLLINELVKLGARHENLEATVAGGALVGPVTRQDMNLDIGGRSADIALAILTSAGIPILKSETGGFFTCTLELDMATGRADISPAWDEMGGNVHDFTPPTMDDISHTIDTLTPIPQTALKIFRLLQEDQYHIDDITEELSSDQVLSAQTLKICNSVLFRGPYKIDTLKEAIVLMGKQILIQSVITAAVDTYYNQVQVSGYSLCKGGLFLHAVGTAVLAEKIALSCKKAQPGSAYAAGLLHDIGKVVLDQFIARGAPLFFRNLQNDDDTALRSEKKLLGVTHCEAGGFLARKWQFSKALSDVILFHHNPRKATENKFITHIVYLADLIMSKFSTSFEHEKLQTAFLADTLRILEMTPEDLLPIIDKMPVKDQLRLL